MTKHTPKSQQNPRPSSLKKSAAMHTYSEAITIAPASPESDQETVLKKVKEVQRVRFWLSPTPPPEEDESMLRRSERLRKEPKREVYTTESRAGEQIPLPASSGWGRNELTNLGVRFSITTNMNLDRVFGVKDSELPAQLKENIEEGCRQLGAVEMADLNSQKVLMPTVRRELAPDFHTFYSSLLALMAVQDSKAKAKAESRSSIAPSSSVETATSRKRPPTSPTTGGKSKKTKVSESQASESKTSKATVSETEPKTPDQPTHPIDANWSGETVTSQDEDNTKYLLMRLINDSLAVLDTTCTNISWQQSGSTVELYYAGPKAMKFKIGGQTVSPKNDGGIGIWFNDGVGFNTWQPTGIRPVLSLEAKRRMSRKRDDPDLAYDYAGQMFCEMLGQICHPEFYNNTESEYQEAFIIHGSHSSVRIYYCKFPNTYLSEIATHGMHNYLSHRTQPHTITLRRTDKFHMLHTPERVELFRILAKLFYYLVSGRSHCGYLFNYAENPIHKIGHVIHDSITVETVPDVEDEQVEETAEFEVDEEMAEFEVDEEAEESKRMQDMIIVQMPPEPSLAEGDSSVSECTIYGSVVEDDALKPDPKDLEIE